MDGVHSLCLLVSPLAIVARELLICEGVEAVDGVGFSLLVVVAKDAGGHLLVSVVGFPIEAVCPNVRGTADVLCPYGDVVFVGEEKEFSKLRHHGWRSLREVGEHPHNGVIVLV